MCGGQWIIFPYYGFDDDIIGITYGGSKEMLDLGFISVSRIVSCVSSFSTVGYQASMR